MSRPIDGRMTMQPAPSGTTPAGDDIFETARPRLLGLAYRILGSLADAEDAVQDCFEKWQGTEKADIRNPAAWLTTICTRRCIDMMRAHDRARVDYVGAWLPEPLQASAPAAAEAGLELASSLNTAFLLVLERLSPRERAAYLLREIFDTPYADVASMLDVSEAACRKLVQRAKGNVESSKARYAAPAERQRDFLDAFREAVTTGETATLAGLLAEDVRLSADSGGKVAALRETLIGGREVLAFITRLLGRYWEGADWQPTLINGTLGALITRPGELVASLSLAAGPDDRITGIYIMRNPEKLAALRPVAIH